MRRIHCKAGVGIVVMLITVAVAAAQLRHVNGRTLVSNKLPQIEVTVADGFEYVGKFDFTLKGIAGGERYVFVDADRKRTIRRLFIFQFEAFLPGVNKTYNYDFRNASVIGAHKFRQNTYAYSNSQSEREAPENEGSLTAKFLRSKGYRFEDEFMMSRFVNVPDPERRNEMILFYLENVSPTGKTIGDFYSGDNETDIWKEISKSLTERSLKAFEIK